ncbi:rhodanese-like domain-containing protein [Antarcticirhabdus aurantiaca]|uniref:Rhodanese-like domain-containing protein n=1 Tax=Antarcticirhabdus aurantiaca TaxID=2606717 RepID=A0ACD4NUR8_9HYPH|nr:rhodanese-like domain-containing protein [Antarcticirhabdus aurantiaca]WAJ30645.1 rhodanese-like domain-containing protein [Jeongeuplla avenae]
MSPRPIGVDEARALLHGTGEVAFLDVREAADYGEGHPLFAVPCSYNSLEAEAARLVPARDVPVILLGDGGAHDVAQRAARRLTALGYVDVRPLAGGAPAWAAAGHALYAGVNVPSKTLGELLEHERHPRTLAPETLAAWQAEGQSFHVFDVRPPGEYAKMRVPGATCAPNGELAHRFDALVPDPATPVVLTCAGRTRGLVGALGLALAGVPNPVFALENGTQGWALAGLPLERGARAAPLPSLPPEAFATSRRRADAIVARHGLAEIDAAAAVRLRRDGTRVTFAFDLRDEEARRSAPVSGAEPVLAGQLVQASDLYMGVRRARVILVDDAGLRAATSAVWLAMMGFEPILLRLDASKAPVDLAPAFAPPLLAPPSGLSPEAGLAMAAEPGTAAMDLRSSEARDRCAVEGAIWTYRAALPDALPAGTRRALLLVSDAGMAARAALDLAEAGIEAAHLVVDPAAMERAGWRLDRAPEPLPQNLARDRVWFVHDRHDGNREASLRYLAWETGLVDQLDAAERAAFRLD